jgi:hypothetical protein
MTGAGYAQDFLQTVKGNVIDKETKESLPGAAIQLIESDTTIAAVTDTSGYFFIQVPVGRQSFRVTFTGYEDLIVPNVLITSGKEVVLNVELREQVTKIKEVVISAQHNMQPINSMAAVSVHELSSQDASRYAGGLFDPSRMVSAFAGVGTADVDLNEIVIRGNSPRGILWRLEDIEIPNPNHFPDGQGGSGGSLSMISSDMLSDFDFLTGAFPAEYGNATSGVMDLNLRKGNADKGEYSFLLGDVGVQATLEGPFAKGYQGSYLINYRYASLSLIDQLHLVNLGDNNVAPKFQDLSFAINLPTKKWGNFELFGVGGNNSTGTTAVKDSALWTNWDQRRDEFEKHNLGILGLKYQYNFPNHRTYIKTVVASSTQYDLWDKGYIIQDYQRQTEEKEDYTNRSTRVNFTINHSFSARSSIRGGVIYNSLWSNMFEELYLWHRKEFNIGVNGIGRSTLWQAYIQNKYRFSDHLELFAGAHAMMLMLNNKYSIEPRFSLKYKLNQRNVITFGTGLHSRIEALPVYYSLVPLPNGSIGEGNKNLGLTKAFHNVLGYDYVPNEKISLKVEAYYQYLFNVPMVDDTSSSESAINLPYGIPDALFQNKGTGHNYGIELTLDKSYENNYYFLYTLSLFDSKFRAGDGNWYNTMYNSHYISNFLIGKDFKLERKNLYTMGLNLKVVYRGGFWTTPIDLSKSQAADRAVYITSLTNSTQLPGVLELDFGVNYRENGKGFAWVLSADIQNLLNTQNILVYEYRGSKGDIATVKGMGIVPVINFKIEF